MEKSKEISCHLDVRAKKVYFKTLSFLNPLFPFAHDSIYRMTSVLLLKFKEKSFPLNVRARKVGYENLSIFKSFVFICRCVNLKNDLTVDKDMEKSKEIILYYLSQAFIFSFTT